MQQFLGLQAAAHVGTLQRRGDVPDFAEAGIALTGAEVGSSAGLIQHQLHILQIGNRPHPAAGFLALEAASTLGQHIQNPVEFQLQKGFFI